MILTDITAFLGELCLYVSTIGFVLSLTGSTGSGIFYVIIGLISEVLCMMCSKFKDVRRYLPIALMIPAFFLEKSVTAVLFPIPLCMLFAVRAIKGRWKAEYDLTKTLFGISLPAYLAVLGIAFLSESIQKFIDFSTPYFLVWLILAVFNMRILRSRDLNSADKKFKILNICLVLGVVAMGLFLSSDFSTVLFGKLMTLFYNYILSPVLMLLLLLPAYLGYLFNMLLNWLLQDNSQNTEFNVEGVSEKIFGDNSGELVGTPQWLERIGIALAVIAFLTVSVLIIRRLITSRAEDGGGSQTILREGFSAETKKKRRRGKLSSGPAGTVRAAYIKYLEICDNFHIDISGKLLSDELSKKSEDYTGWDETRKLRKIWIKARYSSEEVTPGEAKAAREAVKKMKSDAARAKRIMSIEK